MPPAPAIQMVNLDDGADTSNLTTKATNAFAPEAGGLLLVAVWTSVASGTPNEPTLTATGLIAFEKVDTIAAGVNRITLFRALKPAYAASVVITFSWAGQTQTNILWTVDQARATDQSLQDGEGAIRQFRQNTGTSVTTLVVTLGGFDPDRDNATYGVIGVNNADAVVAGSGFTALGTATAGSPNRRIQSQWKNAEDTTVDWSWTNAAGGFGIAVEIAQAPPEVGAGALPQRLAHYGRIGHVARGVFASPYFAGMGGWETREAANGGYMAASGRVPRSHVAGPFKRITEYAEIRSKLEQDGTIVFAGEAQEPAPDGVWSLIAADGHGTKPDRVKAEMFFADWDTYANFHPAASDPHGYTDVNDTISLDTDGRVLLKSTEGQTYEPGDIQRAVYALPGQHLTSLEGQFKQWPGATAPEDYWTARIEAMTFPNGTPETVLEFDLSGADTQDFQTPLPGTDQFAFTLERILTGESSGYWAQLGGQLVSTTLRVRGIAQENVYPASQAVREVCSVIGVSSGMVQESGGNILPLPSRLMTPREILDYAALITGWRWLILDTGAGPVMDFGPWSTRRWRLLDPQKQFHPVPLPRYRFVEATFDWPNGIPDIYRAESTDPTLPRRNRSAYRIRTKMKNQAAARIACQRLLPRLEKTRIGGTARAFTVKTRQGFVVSAAKTHAGDLMDVGGLELQVAEMHKTQDEAWWQMEDDLSFEDRVVTALNLSGPT